MKTFQHFSPYNAQYKLQTVQRALNDTRQWKRVLSSETIAHL